MYPYYAEIDNKQYKINTDYKVALACFKTIDDEDIDDVTRAYALITLLFGVDVEFKDMNKAMDIVKTYLMCGKTYDEQNDAPADIDFEQDSGLIQASFMADYKIDLETTDMHWWKYCDLISGLTEKTVLSKVRDLRNFNINELKDSNERIKMAKAKDKVALKIKRSKKEQKEVDEFEALFE